MTLETIERDVAFWKRDVEGPDSPTLDLDTAARLRDHAGNRLAYFTALREATKRGPVVRVLIEFDVAVIDQDWTPEDLLNNLPDYVLSALQDADVQEMQRFPDEHPYLLDMTDGTVWFPDTEVLDAIHGLEHKPLTPFPPEPA
jgi:hypothetical protein